MKSTGKAWVLAAVLLVGGILVWWVATTGYRPVPPETTGHPPIAERAAPAPAPRPPARVAEANAPAPPPADSPNQPALPVSAATGWSTDALRSSPPAEGPGLILYGRVIRAGGSPIAGARVEVVEAKLAEHSAVLGAARSDKEGRYRVTGLDALGAFVLVEKDGFVPLKEVIGGAPFLANATGVRQVHRDFTLSAGAAVKGRVVDGDDRPVKGAVVVALSDAIADYSHHTAATLEAKTDSEGAFALGNTPSGEVHLVALKEGFSPASRTVSAPADGVVLRLDTPSPNGVIEGAVFHKETGTGIPGAKVRIRYEYSRLKENIQWAWVETSIGKIQIKSTGDFICYSPVMTTDDNGLFRFAELPPAPYELDAEKEGLFSLVNHGTTGATVTLGKNEHREDVKIFLYNGHRIHGRVTDKRTGEPMEGVEVSVSGMFRQFVHMVTPSDGTYELRCTGTNAILMAKKPGFRPAEGSRYGQPLFLNLAPDRLEVEKDIQMIPSVTVSGRVLRSGDVPAADAEVSVASDKVWFGQYYFQPVGSGGAFELETTPFTSFVILARAPGKATAISDPMTVEDKPLTGVEVRFQPGAALSGVVVDESDQPVENAIVSGSLEFQSNAQNREIMPCSFPPTDTEGHFQKDLMTAGKYRIYARKAGYANSQRIVVTLKSGETKADVRLVIRASLELAGRITDPDGNPLEGVQVIASAPSNNSVGSEKTGPDGRYRVGGLANVPHDVTLSHPKWGMKTIKGVEAGRDDADFVLGDEAGIKFVGTVVDEGTGKPINAPRVKIDFVPYVPDVGAVLDPATPGRFEIRGLDTQHMMRVTIDATGYPQLQSDWYRFKSSDRVVERTFKLGASGTISGRVVDTTTKKPVAGVSVLLKSASSEVGLRFSQTQTATVSGANGSFVFQNAQAGYHLVTVVSPSASVAAVTRKFPLQAGERKDLGDLEIGGAGATIEGRLIKSGGSGVPDTPISLSEFDVGLQKKTTTGAKGEFRFENLPNGNFLVNCEARGLSRWVNVNAGDTVQVELVLGGATVSGQVLRAGVPVQAAMSLHQMETQETQQKRTDGEGRFSFTNVTPGQWSVNAHVQGGKFVYDFVKVTGNETYNVTLRFPCAEIHGRVLDTADKPVEGAEVAIQRVRAPDEPIATFHPKTDKTTTASDGAFRFTELPEGLYQVTARKAGAGTDQRDNVHVDDGGIEEVTLHLGQGESGTLVSSVINVDTGEPIRDVIFVLSNDSGDIPVTVDRDDQGIARIENLPTGKYRVRAGGKRYNSTSHEIEIKGNETTLVEDELYEAGSFYWKIVDPDGKTVSFQGRLEPTDPSSRQQAVEGPSDPYIGFSRNGLRPGNYRATASLPDGSTITKTVTIQVGEATEIQTNRKP